MSSLNDKILKVFDQFLHLSSNISSIESLANIRIDRA